MSYTTATFPGVIAFDDRGLGARRRTVFGGVAVGLGTVTAASATTGAVIVTAAWMMAASFAANPHLNGRPPLALETAALTKSYTLLAGATDFSGWARILAPSADPPAVAPLAAEGREGATLHAELASAPLPTHMTSGTLTSERIDGVSLLTPHSLAGPQIQAQQNIARRSAGSAAPQVAALVPPPAASASVDLSPKRTVPPQASNNSISLPGPDSHTAVYDIEAHTVYLPNGARLEAHSGLGKRLDDPHYVKEKDRGPTPPNVYDLTYRGELFHGVRAIRLNPVDDGKMFGRDGILAHTYMLGPTGQSFGCVSFKDYSAFLQAFSKGEIDRLVVVPHLGNRPSHDERARTGNADRYALNNR
jgi:Tlde1 domain